MARKACLATCGDRHWFCKRVLFLSWDFVLMRLEERGCRAGRSEGSPRHRRAAKPSAAPRPPRRSGFAMPVSSRRSLNVGEGPPLFRPQPPGSLARPKQPVGAGHPLWSVTFSPTFYGPPKSRLLYKERECSEGRLLRMFRSQPD